MGWGLILCRTMPPQLWHHKRLLRSPGRLCFSPDRGVRLAVESHPHPACVSCLCCVLMLVCTHKQARPLLGTTECARPRAPSQLLLLLLLLLLLIVIILFNYYLAIIIISAPSPAISLLWGPILCRAAPPSSGATNDCCEVSQQLNET